MKVAVFGLGYVGCVSAACLARGGHEVFGVETSAQKIEIMRSGKSPVVEPGLCALVQKAVASGRLQVTSDARAAVLRADLSLICVGTPSNGNGSLGLHYLLNVCGEIGAALATTRDYHVVVVRSTVLPGTIEEKLIPILEQTSGRRAGGDFGVCMNPEFLREGSAIHDYDRPSYIVLGQLDPRSGDAARGLYRRVEAPLIRTTIRTAEMLKYASNAFHAMKVAFANEIGALCKAHDVDGREVMEIFCQDRKLNLSPSYLRPGFAFGGSCLPKDLRALLYRAKERDLTCPLLGAVLPSNQKQIERGIELVEAAGNRRVGVLGLSFKSGTDDVRESPVVPMVETLIGRGYQLAIYDEKVDPARLVGANRSFLERELPHIALLMRHSMDEVLSESQTVVIANPSGSFAEVSDRIREDQILIDLVGNANGRGACRGTYAGIGW